MLAAVGGLGALMPLGHTVARWFGSDKPQGIDLGGSIIIVGMSLFWLALCRGVWTGNARALQLVKVSGGLYCLALLVLALVSPNPGLYWSVIWMPAVASSAVQSAQQPAQQG